MINASDLIPFGEWMPDMGQFSNEGAYVAMNCLTEGDKYKPFPSLQENTESLPDVCYGSYAYRDAAGNVTIFAGTRNKLYRLSNGQWIDVTRATGGDYSTAKNGFWKFVSFGDLVIATNYNDDIQVFDIGSSVAFELLSSTAPRCRNLMVISNFLMALDIVDGDGSTGYRVSWCPINNPRGVWTPDPTVTQADSQDLYGGDYSNVAGVTINDYGLIFQGKTIWRVQYQGGATIFEFDKVEEGRGSNYARSVITDGVRAFFLDDAGYYMHVNGQSVPIGNKKIDKHILKLIDQANTDKINSSIDAVNKVVMMAFPSIASPDGECDRILIYNWADDRFTLVSEKTQILFTYLSSSYTLEQIDDIYSNLDNVEFSLDSRFWTGGKTILGAFTTNARLGSFVGAPKTATISTPEVRLNNSGKTTVHGVIPYIEGGQKTGRLGSRDKLNQPVRYTQIQAVNSFTDELDFMRDAIYHRMEMTISGEWEIAHGLAIRFQSSGNI